MEQIGRVIAVDGARAVIETRRVSACGENCAMCKGGCMPTQHRATVSNPIGAVAGDVVKVAMADRVVLRGAALVYLLPVLLLFVCYGLGNVMLQSTAAAVVCAFVGLAAGFVVVWLADKRFRRLPEIVKILSN